MKQTSLWVLIIVVSIIAQLTWFRWQDPEPVLVPPEDIVVTYSAFRRDVMDGNVVFVEIETTRLVGHPVQNGAPRLLATYRSSEGDGLIPLLEEYGVEFEYIAATDTAAIILGFAAVLLLIAIGIGTFNVVMQIREKRGSTNLVVTTPSVRFAQVAGVEEAKTELQEVVAYLRSPGTFSRLGARPPRGVLLHGPPGTGKTMLAQAVAGEAGVPFFHASGSDFVEKYVGTGAARVRELFAQARKKAPCILFIDEVDAVGTRRSDDGSGNREHAQTLNALLACIDGFANDPKAPPIVLIAATNRPDVLDPAFTRAGRFDRQVCVMLPGPAARKEMFIVHTRQVVLAEGIDLVSVAEQASGMSGAQIANVVNEAARSATRRRADSVTDLDFREAFDVIQIGGKSSDRVVSRDERRRTAVHEAGHAVLARAGGIPIRRVTILPRGQALGANILGGQDTPPTMASEVYACIAMFLGGHAAEELVLGIPSLGSFQDLAEANKMLMVLYRSGYSKKFPLLPLSEHANESWRDLMDERSAALRAILAYARSVLEANRSAFDRLTEELLRKETILRDELDVILSDVKADPPSL